MGKVEFYPRWLIWFTTRKGSHQSFICTGSNPAAFTQTQTMLFSARTSVKTMAADCCRYSLAGGRDRAQVNLSKRLAETRGGIDDEFRKAAKRRKKRKNHYFAR